MQTAKKTYGMNKGDQAISLERYLRMNEKEKDAEIQNAIIRLQRRIQEILYLVESENIRMIMQAAPYKDTQPGGEAG